MYQSIMLRCQKFANDKLKEKALIQATLWVVKNLKSLIDYAAGEEAARQINPFKEIAYIAKKPQQNKQSAVTYNYFSKNSYAI